MGNHIFEPITTPNGHFGGWKLAQVLDRPYLSRILRGHLPPEHPTLNHSRNLKRHYEIHGTLANTSVAALPDTGSGHNILSLAFANEHKLNVDQSAKVNFLLPSGQMTRSVGSVKVTWSFLGESKPLDIIFDVLPRCTHPVILGKEFLKLTRTLTHLAQRIKSKLLPVSAQQGVRLLGRQNERVLGLLEGRPVTAVPDTGSDVMLISKAYAIQHNYQILKDQHLRSELEFADGSRAITSGIIPDLRWRFGSSDQDFWCDFHVLDDLVESIVLSNDFLFGTDAFSVYAPSFYDEDVLTPELVYELSLVKQISWLGESFRRVFRRTAVTGTHSPRSDFTRLSTWLTNFSTSGPRR
ncbi:hypothetical protein BU16DRAFT_96813 [Lophium mytilinum]|uniref:Peptidase A2 domain-containing protein n=1 Tax=Lophium mytilinum TaxID=390894 RepID=A0A6A6QKR9_9PEZI|nr:hypothetical protein BU16DRAFT_96813 [Lophium mytilinum]